MKHHHKIPSTVFHYPFPFMMISQGKASEAEKGLSATSAIVQNTLLWITFPPFRWKTKVLLGGMLRTSNLWWVLQRFFRQPLIMKGENGGCSNRSCGVKAETDEWLLVVYHLGWSLGPFSVSVTSSDLHISALGINTAWMKPLLLPKAFLYLSTDTSIYVQVFCSRVNQNI